MSTENTENLFSKLGCEVKFGDVDIGNTYPLYGMITRIISDQPGNVVVELNHQIELWMDIPDPAKIELLKERAFEPGIFVSYITQVKPRIIAECTTVVFGKQHRNLA
jgi:hypothetical protein